MYAYMCRVCMCFVCCVLCVLCALCDVCVYVCVAWGVPKYPL